MKWPALTSQKVGCIGCSKNRDVLVEQMRFSYPRDSVNPCDSGIAPLDIAPQSRQCFEFSTIPNQSELSSTTGLEDRVSGVLRPTTV